MSRALNKATLGSNENDLLKHNRSTLVKLLMKNGACSRAQLAQIMHLTQAAISKTTNNLIQEGIIEEGLPLKGGKGRRIIPLNLKSDAFQFIGIRITWKYFFVGVFTISGDCFAYEYENTNDANIENICERIIDKVNAYCRKFDKIIAAGVSVPSPYIGQEGRILPIGEKGTWGDFDIRSIRKRVEIPVYFKNDAKAGALAEWWFGNHQCKVLFHLLVGEELSSSIIVDGEPFVGSYGIAGEIGQTVVDYSTGKLLSDYCTEQSFLHHTRCNIPENSVLNTNNFITLQDVFDAAARNDAYSIACISELGRYLGIAIANSINLFNPDTVVISGMFTNAGQLLLDAIKKTASSLVVPYVFEKVSIEYSSVNRQWIKGSNQESTPILGQIDTSVLGAVAVAVDMFLEDTSRFVNRDNSR